MKLFTQKLREKQGSMTVTKFARLLGISVAEWSRIRLGHREPSRRIQQKALALWPDLAYWLAEDARASRKAS